MSNNTITKHALINGLLTAVYVAFVGIFFHSVPLIFGRSPGTPDTVFVPIFMLSLFVFSAALCGAL
ncbi:MAG: hypothetical protein KGI59_03480, partial [Patescibacteria group bacterium]|nr:hypothetical protein [Patescibacteria group bacterium]